jgi:hypothetical protein
MTLKELAKVFDKLRDGKYFKDSKFTKKEKKEIFHFYDRVSTNWMILTGRICSLCTRCRHHTYEERANNTFRFSISLTNLTNDNAIGEISFYICDECQKLINKFVEEVGHLPTPEDAGYFKKGRCAHMSLPEVIGMEKIDV